jgi:hypothetical protein
MTKDTRAVFQHPAVASRRYPATCILWGTGAAQGPPAVDPYQLKNGPIWKVVVAGVPAGVRVLKFVS